MGSVKGVIFWLLVTLVSVLLSQATSTNEVVTKWLADMHNIAYDCDDFDPDDVFRSAELFVVVDCNDPEAVYNYHFEVRLKLCRLCQWKS